MVVTKSSTKSKRQSTSSSSQCSASSNNKGSKAGTSNKACSNCDKPVHDDKSLQCDLCEEYTHLVCDKSISTKLYDALSECKDNSLIYLCVLCKPSLKHRKDTNAANQKLIDALEAQNAQVTETTNTSMSTQTARLDTLNAKIANIENALEQNNKLLYELTRHEPTKKRDSNEHNRQSALDPNRVWSEVVNARPSPTQSAPKNPHSTENDPKNSLVIYGISCNYDPAAVILQICADLGINKRWVVNITALSPSSATPPIKITCINSNVKWNLLVGINALKLTNTYAKLYLSKEDLQKDRALVQKVVELRKLHPTRLFKIRKGKIVEEIEGYLVDF